MSSQNEAFGDEDEIAWEIEYRKQLKREAQADDREED